MLVQLEIIARDAQTAGRRNVPNLPQDN